MKFARSKKVYSVHQPPLSPGASLVPCQQRLQRNRSLVFEQHMFHNTHMECQETHKEKGVSLQEVMGLEGMGRARVPVEAASNVCVVALAL